MDEKSVSNIIVFTFIFIKLNSKQMVNSDLEGTYHMYLNACDPMTRRSTELTGSWSTEASHTASLVHKERISRETNKRILFTDTTSIYCMLELFYRHDHTLCHN